MSQQLVEFQTSELDRRPLKAPYRPLGCELLLTVNPTIDPAGPAIFLEIWLEGQLLDRAQVPSDKALDAFNHPFLYGLQP